MLLLFFFLHAVKCLLASVPLFAGLELSWVTHEHGIHLSCTLLRQPFCHYRCALPLSMLSADL